MKKTCTLIVSLVFSLTTSFAQQGKDGAKTITTKNVVVNEYTALTADAAAGDNSITVSDNTLNANNRFSGPLSAGDLVMIIQVQGATISKTVNDSTWGTITNYSNCGLNEVKQVTSVTGNTIINLLCPLQNNYTDTGRVEVVRIPRFSSLTINTYDTLTCDAWNGVTGGIVALEVSGNTSISYGGAINASAKGFRGGALENNGITIDIALEFASLKIGNGAEKGESIAGYESDYTVYGGEYGRGAAANGGGGGNATNSSGGGGANAGDTTIWTGNGNPDVTTDTSWRQAWRLEYYGFAKSTSSGGGRGGYAAARNPYDPLTLGPNNALWDPTYYRENDGGKGGRPLDYSTGRLFFGGGGGAGHENDEHGGGGGIGGGIIYLLSYGTVSGSGSIVSNGQNGGDDDASAYTNSNPDGDGSGGAGSGGTIILNSTGNITGVSAYANGGTGGNQYIDNYNVPYESEGPGGGGGGGYIATSNGSITTKVLGGANGTTNSPGMTAFIPNGATKGGAGITSMVCNLQLGAITGPDTTCSGSSVTYSVPGSCNNAKYTWTLPTGWSGTSTSNTITVTVGSSSGTVSIESCPFDTSITVIVDTASLTIQPPSQSICVGQSITLSVPVSGSDYFWSPSSSLNSSTGDSVIATPTLQTTYTVTGKNSLGCTVSASDTILVQYGINKPIIADTNNLLTSSATQGNQWYRNGAALNGATNETYMATDTGCYWTIATNIANGCNTVSDTICIRSLSGIDQLQINPDQLSIFPNPTGGEIFIDISSSAVDVKNWNLQIIDVLGRIVYTKQSLNYSNEIDVSNLASGVYFISVINKSGREVVPVVKQ